MYEPNDPERNLICHLRACDNETLEIITPGCGGRMLTAAPCFQPIVVCAKCDSIERARHCRC
jgi:hypothetical protein